MKEREGSPLGLYMIGIAALFLAGALLLVVLGARTYRGTVSMSARNNEERAILSYLCAMVRGNDRAGQISLRGDGPEGSDVLVIGDGSSYASRLYVSGGYLVEDYAAADAPYDSANAMRIGETQTFAVTFAGGEEESGGLLRADTDEGSVYLRVYSGSAAESDKP